MAAIPIARRDHVVVTGAAGFIGSHLAGALVDRGHQLVGLDAFSGHYPAADKWANLSGLLTRPGFELHRLDLATAEVEPLLAGAAAVFHLAARPGVAPPSAPASPATCTTTCSPPSGCWRAASGPGPAPGRGLVVQRLRGRPPLPGHRGVEDPAGVALRRDQAGRRAALPGLRPPGRAAHGRGRPALLHRLRSAPAARHGLPPVHRGRHGRPVVVYGDGGQTRDFTYVDDVVRASLLAMTAPVEVEAVNIGGGRRVGLVEALALIGEATGRPLVVDRRPPRPGDARHTGPTATG